MIRVLALSLLLAAPAAAQEPDAQAPDTQGSDTQEGIDLMQEGARLLFRGLLDDMAPTILQMREFAEVLENLDQYHPPEILPNGDVILRRKVPLEAPTEVDL
jgi:hypothetical protein